jgi:hypothetical protein
MQRGEHRPVQPCERNGILDGVTRRLGEIDGAKDLLEHREAS